MTDTMIERVARAMWEQVRLRHPQFTRSWEAENERLRADWRENARAAIEAMREPTPAICAAIRDWSEAEHDRTWREAIDAALKGGQE